MAATRKLEVLITGNAKGAQKALGDLEKASGRAGKKTEGALSKANQALIGFGAGAAIYGAFSAFDDAQKVTAQTEAVLKSTGNAANVTADEISDLAGAMSKKTGIDDEAIQSGENLLLTFKNIRNEAGEGNDVFNQTAQAALDMSVAMGTDMSSASVMLGKALNDPITGLSKLTKVGVTFTEGQKKQIKALAESGDRLGAQKVILQELNSEFGGSAEAQATSLGKAKVSVDNMAESVGGALAPALENAAKLIGAVADGFSNLPEWAQTSTLAFGGLAVAAVKWGPGALDLLRKIPPGLDTMAGKAYDAAGAFDQVDNKLGKVGAAVGVAGAGLAAFTLTLDALESAAATGTDIGNLTTDLKQLGDGAAAVSDVTGTMGIDVLGLADAFARSADSPKDFGDALKYAFNNRNADWNASDLRSAQNQVEDLDTALANAVNSGNIDQAKRAYGEIALAMSKQGIPIEDIAAQMPKYDDAVNRAGREANTTAGSVAKAAGALGEMADETDGAAQSTEQYNAYLKENADKYGDLEKRAQEATRAISDFYDETTGALSTQIEVERALDDLSQGFRENGQSLDISSEAGRKNNENLIAAKDAQVAYAERLRDTSGTGAAVEAMTGYSNKLAETLRQSGLTEAQTAALIAEMGLTPTQIFTTFGSNATEAESRAAAVRRSIEQIPGWKDIYFNALTADAEAAIARLSQQLTPLGSSVLSGTAGAAIQQSQAAHGRRKDNAGGGGVNAGDWGWVGEKGPELVNWGSSARVYPHAKSMAMSGGGQAPIVVNVQGDVVGIDNLADKITDAMNRRTRMAGKSQLRTSLASVEF